MLFIIAKKIEKNSNIQTNKWINKMVFIHTMKYHLATKRNEVQYMIQHE